MVHKGAARVALFLFLASAKKKKGLQRVVCKPLIFLVEMRRIELLAYALRTLSSSIPD